MRLLSEDLVETLEHAKFLCFANVYDEKTVPIMREGLICSPFHLLLPSADSYSP